MFLCSAWVLYCLNPYVVPGWGLSGNCAVCCVPGGRAAVHPLFGCRSAGAEAHAVLLFALCHALYRRRDATLQPGTAQVSCYLYAGVTAQLGRLWRSNGKYVICKCWKWNMTSGWNFFSYRTNKGRVESCFFTLAPKSQCSSFFSIYFYLFYFFM